MTPLAEPVAAPRSAVPAAPQQELIQPHGPFGQPTRLVDRVVRGGKLDALRKEAAGLPRVQLSAKQSCDLEMLGSGAFSPLDGFMGRADFESVCREMRLADGTVWSIPILLAVPAVSAPRPGDRVALWATAASTGKGVLQGVLTVTETFPHDKKLEIPAVFRTEDAAHPGVKQVLEEGEVCLAGPVEVVQPCVDPAGPEAFLDHRLTPAQTRDAFARLGWKTIAAFQTRNPIHRAHEYLCKCAQEICDGLLIHPLVGETKPGDVPAAVRMRCYAALIEGYFNRERTLLAVMPAAMRYAGPREAVLHAIVRRNHGCSHFIVGRDHAGVGAYYGTYDAQRLFDEIDPRAIGITPLRFENSAWSRRAGGMVTAKSFPTIEGDQVTLSGTRLREMLAAGQRPPAEVTRPEIADILIEWARSAG